MVNILFDNLPLFYFSLRVKLGSNPFLVTSSTKQKWTWRDKEISPPSDTCPHCITKKTIESMCICLSNSLAPFHWFNRYAYLKLGVSASYKIKSFKQLIHYRKVKKLSIQWESYMWKKMFVCSYQCHGYLVKIIDCML